MGGRLGVEPVEEDHCSFPRKKEVASKILLRSYCHAASCASLFGILDRIKFDRVDIHEENFNACEDGAMGEIGLGALDIVSQDQPPCFKWLQRN